MKCLDDCHTYEMETVLQNDKIVKAVLKKIGGEEFRPMLRFYEMREDGTKIDGVTNEEVLRVLIHRMEALDEKTPWENKQAISSLKGALSWLNARTEQRVKRGVEGTHKP